jgi:hypothetical protein
VRHCTQRRWPETFILNPLDNLKNIVSKTRDSKLKRGSEFRTLPLKRWLHQPWRNKDHDFCVLFCLFNRLEHPPNARQISQPRYLGNAIDGLSLSQSSDDNRFAVFDVNGCRNLSTVDLWVGIFCDAGMNLRRANVFADFGLFNLHCDRVAADNRSDVQFNSRLDTFDILAEEIVATLRLCAEE